MTRSANFSTSLAGERTDYKLIIFAFFRETLNYLQRRLALDDIGVVLAWRRGGGYPSCHHRTVPQPARRSCFAFESGRQRRPGLPVCDTMVNYDLPWNPMEVEQRIGRLDRIGQQSEVIRIVNLWTLDTIEERILRRLYDRLGVFERSIGALDAVLGDVIRRLEREAISRELSPDEARKEADRIAGVLVGQAAEADRLEGEAVRFVGADEYFNEEVIAIKANRRYVTGEQLRRFLLDFIRVHASGTKLRYDHREKTGILFPDSTLQSFLKAQKVAGDLISFCSRPYRSWDHFRLSSSIRAARSGVYQRAPPARDRNSCELRGGGGQPDVCPTLIVAHEASTSRYLRVCRLQTFCPRCEVPAHSRVHSPR